MILTEKQKEYIKNATHRYNIKIGATRSGKTYLDIFYTIPSRIRERAGLEGLYVILGVYKGTIERNVLEPLRDKSLHIDVPVDNKLGLIKELITKEEIDKLIKNIPNIEIADDDDRKIELLDSGTHEDLIKVIKTAYIRNKNREKTNKKISERDTKYFNLAEEYLYSEIGIVLNITFDEVKDYIISKITKDNL